MTIAGIKGEGKPGLGRIPADYLIVLILLASVAAAFGLGILLGRELAEEEQSGVWIEEMGQGGGAAAVVTAPIATAPPAPQARTYVASKSGTRYYLPTCSGVKRIKEENKIWFASKEMAEAEGYEPAANCPGL